MLTAEQIEQRKDYITGSDCGTICGVNKWQTPVQLWQIKTRRIDPEDISDKPSVFAGHMLEDTVAKWFTHVTHKETYKEEIFHVHSSIPFLGGNIDRFIVGENALLECKTTQSDLDWGAGYMYDDNQIPSQYLCQVIHYCAITNCDVAYVAVLIRGVDFRWFKYERNLALEKQIIQMEIDFWQRYVELDVAPPPQTSTEVMQLLQGKVSDDSVYADDDIALAVKELKDVRQAIEGLEETAKILQDKICIYMNDAQTLLDTNGRILVSWKQREGNKTFDSKAFKFEYPELYETFRKQGKDVRTFLLKV